MQINLTGFLGGGKARLFIGELWQFLASAQTSPDGIPAELVEMKKKELLKTTGISAHEHKQSKASFFPGG